MSSDVKRAPRGERIKRTVWMLASIVIAAGLVICPMVLADLLGYPSELVPIAIASFLLDHKIFSWGFDRFDLVAPKEFREVEDS